MITKYINTFKGLSRSVWILAFVMFVNRSGTMVIPFLTIYLTKELGFTLMDAGYVMSFFGLGSLIGTYIGGELTDRIGYYRVMISSLIMTGIMFVLLNYVHSFWSISLMVFLTSVISDTFRPANLTAIATLSNEEDRTRSITLIRLAINAGWSVGPAIGGVMIAYIGYEFLFWADGITNVLAAVFLAVLLKEKYVTLAEKEDLSKDKTKIAWPSNFLWFILVNTLAMIAFFQMFNTLPVYFRSEMNLSEDIIGALMAINGIILVLFEMPLVFRLENRYNSLHLVSFGVLIIGVSYLVLILGNSYWIAAICILLLSVGELLEMPFSNAYTMKIADKRYMGKYLAMYGISFSIAFIISPGLGMFIADNYGYNTLWVSMLGFCIGALMVLYFLVIKQDK